MTRREIRRETTQLIRGIPPDARVVMDAQITNAITGLAAWEAADTVLGYVAMNDEADLQGVFSTAFREGKRLGLPRIEEGSPHMRFHLVDADPGNCPQRLEPHHLGFRQPPADAPQIYPPLDNAMASGNAAASGDAAAPGTTIMVVPGRAFDRSGYRVGRGGGFYNRFLSLYGHGLATVGTGYTCQLFQAVPREESDVPVHMVVTDSEICLARLF